MFVLHEIKTGKRRDEKYISDEINLHCCLCDARRRAHSVNDLLDGVKTNDS